MPNNITPPLERLYPNRDSAIEEGIPLVVAILFGFSGTYFAAATALPDNLKLQLQLPPFFSTAWQYHLEIGIRAAVLIVTAASCFFFYLSFRAALYAKMHNVSLIQAGLAAGMARLPQNQEAIDRNIERREQQILLSLFAFNIGLLLLPFAVLVFLPPVWASALTILYAVLASYRAISEAIVTWREKYASRKRFEVIYPLSRRRSRWLR